MSNETVRDFVKSKGQKYSMFSGVQEANYEETLPKALNAINRWDEVKYVDITGNENTPAEGGSFTLSDEGNHFDKGFYLD